MRTRFFSAFASILLVSAAAASASTVQTKQKPVVAFASDTPAERVSAGILFFNQEKQRSVGNVNISYGQPVWKAEYEDAPNLTP